MWSGRRSGSIRLASQVDTVVQSSPPKIGAFSLVGRGYQKYADHMARHKESSSGGAALFSLLVFIDDALIPTHGFPLGLIHHADFSLR
jgi:hypothetical protein